MWTQGGGGGKWSTFAEVLYGWPLSLFNFIYPRVPLVEVMMTTYFLFQFIININFIRFPFYHIYILILRINIPERVKGKQLMLLYGLKNYYQNHRLYRQSQSFVQMLGDIDANCLTDYCKPYSYGEKM